MDIITYALSKKGIINVDGKQYKPELENGNIVYKEIEKEKPEEPGEYTTFTLMDSIIVDENNMSTLVMANNFPNSITELYINDVPQELPTLSLAELMGGDTDNKHFTMLKLKKGDIVKIKGGFSLTANNGDLTGIFEGNNEFNISNIILQNDLEDCSFMFMGCTSLTEAPVIPQNAKNCSYMFSYCTSLTEAPIIPNSVTNCSWMFVKCTGLTTLPSENVALLSNHPDELVFENCYIGCVNIINPITIDDIPVAWGGNKVEEPELVNEYTTFIMKWGGRIRISIEDVAEPAITELYINGEQQELPELEKEYNVEEGQEVKIKGHFKLRLRGANITNVKLQSNLTDCREMFYSCFDLLIAPEIPEGVTNCERMFCGCSNLLIAPVIPNSVKNCQDMFDGCENLEKLPQENINLMYNHSEELEHHGCYGGCQMIRDIVLEDWGGERSQEEEMPEEFGEYTTFIMKGDSNIRISIEDVAEPAIMELYIDGERQQSPEHKEMYFVREGQEVKIKGHFKLRDANITRVKLQSNLIDCRHMFEGCELLIAPEIPNNVTNCEGMFVSCGELLIAPIIPSTVTNCCNMFTFCGNLEKLPQENVDLMYNHDELEHHGCYTFCEKINDPISYDEIPDDWK